MDEILTTCSFTLGEVCASPAFHIYRKQPEHHLHRKANHDSQLCDDHHRILQTVSKHRHQFRGAALLYYAAALGKPVLEVLELDLFGVKFRETEE